MAVDKAQLKKMLDDTLKAMTDARPNVDSYAALIDSLQQQLADALANASDLTEAAAAVDAIMVEYKAQVKSLSDAALAPGNVP